MKSIQIIEKQYHNIEHGSKFKQTSKSNKKKPSKSLQSLNISPTRKVSLQEHKRSVTQNNQVIHSMFPKIRQESIDFIETLKLLKKRRHSSFILGDTFKAEKSMSKKSELIPNANQITSIKICQSFVQEYMKQASDQKNNVIKQEKKIGAITFKGILDSLCITSSPEPPVEMRSKSVPLKCCKSTIQQEPKSKKIKQISQQYMSIRSMLPKQANQINLTIFKNAQRLNLKICADRKEKKKKLGKYFPQSRIDNKGLSPWHSYNNTSYYGLNA